MITPLSVPVGKYSSVTTCNMGYKWEVIWPILNVKKDWRLDGHPVGKVVGISPGNAFPSEQWKTRQMEAPPDSDPLNYPYKPGSRIDSFNWVCIRKRGAPPVWPFSRFPTRREITKFAFLIHLISGIPNITQLLRWKKLLLVSSPRDFSRGSSFFFTYNCITKNNPIYS